MEGKKPFFLESSKKTCIIKQIANVIGFRIILEDIDKCYKTLNCHIKNDYLENLKTIFRHQINGYKSIHAVIGSYKKPIEIQIRTKEIHDFAKEG